MNIKKEVQEQILPADNGSLKATEEEFLSVLKSVSPGTNLRAALDGALKLGKGALIALENDYVIPLMDGGFKINCKFNPSRLVELTKMDGAIVLSKDAKRINYANVLLTPDSKIKTSETGTRHKASERTAKQAGTLVIAISERKKEITLYYKDIKYHLKDSDEILRKVNEHIQILEKQRELFDTNLRKLNRSELRGHPSPYQAVQLIQKGQMIMMISDDLKEFIIEVGNEGLLVKTRLKEIILGVEKEMDLTIKDYTRLDLKKSKIILKSLSYDEILEKDNVFSALSIKDSFNNFNIKGWRILSKTSLNGEESSLLVKHFSNLKNILDAKISDYSQIISLEKSEVLRDELEKFKLNL